MRILFEYKGTALFAPLMTFRNIASKLGAAKPLAPSP